ncbi:GDSL-like Lipase/Acylhydrolase family protein [Amycolatopsis xylanica]|uniref:GDSL-like Lipase/Acylhydrolase family protein n=1 Tax=Amycolatopsis xylanica TaxID=589385 RepID=A0A1H3HJB8_9PSEU|nr:SGNH/GDSL hydrolase family protein [Amycolatopsis xylanica]SDY15581.1 GDSL-like Lipase/Acylhydrolase family protein [Amycolatopsis xylanica]
MRTVFTAAAATIVLLASTLTAQAGVLNYVALGDSYTSGPLIPQQRSDPLGCGRSKSNYPAIVAARLGAQYTDVSCAGAATAQMAYAQPTVSGTNAAQFKALETFTDLVTVGIGGNDFDLFRKVIDACPLLRASDSTGNPCERRFSKSGTDSIKAVIPTISQRVKDVLAGIHVRSPKAKVYAIGYPRILPPSGYCPIQLPFADGDYAWLNSVEEALNAAIADAVKADGNSSYVDLYGPSLGHDACAGNAAWINGKDDSRSPAAAAYHPFLAGMEGMANVVYQQVTRP